MPQTESNPDPPSPPLVEQEPELPPLRTGVRILLFALGGLFLLLGIIGVLLPVVPQIVPLALGAALLSLASDRLNRRLRAFVMRRWPNAWRRIQRVQAWLHHRLS